MARSSSPTLTPFINVHTASAHAPSVWDLPLESGRGPVDGSEARSTKNHQSQALKQVVGRETGIPRDKHDCFRRVSMQQSMHTLIYCILSFRIPQNFFLPYMPFPS